MMSYLGIFLLIFVSVNKICKFKKLPSSQEQSRKGALLHKNAYFRAVTKNKEPTCEQYQN